MYKEIPETVRVGFKDYKIEIWTVGGTLNTGRYGECDHFQSIIRISKDLCAMELANTLYHEICHAVFYCFNIPNGDGEDRINHMTEERVVQSLASGMICVYRDNPKLLKFYQKCIDVVK